MMWLRLGEAEQAYKHHQYQLKYGMNHNFFGGAAQLDGTFGSTAVVAEMLLQSHNNAIEILPALPGFWKNGEVSGLRARGNVEVSMKWKENKMGSVILKSFEDKTVQVKYNTVSRKVKLRKGQSLKLNGELNPIQ